MSGEWISVEDRLPDGDNHYEVYLIVARWIGGMEKKHGADGPHVDTCRFLHHKKLWIRDTGDEEVFEYHEDLVITHWMPLPEPPEKP